MNLNKFLLLSKDGKSLTQKQIDSLAISLKLKESKLSVAFKIVILIITAGIMALVFTKIENLVIDFIILALAIAFILFVFLYRNNEKRIITYLDALKDFYINRFKDFEGFETVFLQHQFQKNGYLQNKYCIMLTDGYDFYIFDDMLKETDFRLPKQFKSKNNKTPVLKVFDSTFVEKKPVYFKLSEIDYFMMVRVYQPTLFTECFGDEYRRYTYSNPNFELEDYCVLELNDKSIFKFSSEAYEILKRKAKGKEKTL